MKINIYTSLNGVGLEADANLLKDHLQGHEVHLLDWRTKQRGMRCDIAIHLEIPRYDCIRLAKRNIFIPNPEWFNIQWKSGLNNFTEIWCKTQDCKRIFEQLHTNTKLSGFISNDMYMQDVRKSKLIIHVSGKSMSKGTKQICEAYKRNKNLPKCYLISSHKWECTNNLIGCERLPYNDLKILMNSSLIHLCPSSYEGWGHYIHEALSTAANIITTDHPPMNEFASGIKIDSTERMGLADIGNVSVSALSDEIQRLYSLSTNTLVESGKLNRDAFLKRNSDFINFLNNSIL